MRVFLLFEMDGTFHSILMAMMVSSVGLEDTLDWLDWLDWLPVRKNLFVIPDAAEAEGAYHMIQLILGAGYQYLHTFSPFATEKSEIVFR